MRVEKQGSSNCTVRTRPTKKDHIQGYNKRKRNPTAFFSFAFENPTIIAKRRFLNFM
jgi:hypothetical protein